jgi:hypothetical protein
MSLTDPQQLVNALFHFEKRETLIRDLTLTPISGENRFHKLVMAFWLGSGVTRNPLLVDFCSDTKTILSYLDWGYYCILTINRHISLLQNEGSVYQALNHIMTVFFLYYNDHYSSLLKAPKVLFYPLIHGFNELPTTLMGNQQDSQILENTKKLCLGLLSELMLWQNSEQPPSPRSTQGLFCEFSEHVMWPSYFLSNARKAIIRSVTSASLPIHAFNIPIAWPPSLIDIYKFLLPGHDGMILEGTYLGRKDQNTDTVVLVLIAQLQAEHSYLSLFIHSLPELFHATVVLINHRNFSLHSSGRAENLNEISLDIESFAHHFMSRGKSLVLYGMCGSAGPMLLAAKRLLEANIPFKIIIDRFARNYRSFYDYKTVKRGRDWLNVSVKDPLKRSAYPQFMQAFLVCIILNYWVRLLCLFLARIPSHFDTIINQIPETDLLILQAKGPKLSPDGKPAFEDMLIHPENELRNVVKTRRNQRKSQLDSLKNRCLELKLSLKYHPSLGLVFQQLSIFFDLGLQLISNEKLTGSEFLSQSHSNKDIHAIPFSLLSTRKSPPIDKFISGFFSKPSDPSIRHIRLLNSSLQEAIGRSFQLSHPETETDDLELFTQSLGSLFDEIAMHADYIANLADRLVMANMLNIADIVQTFHDMTQTDALCSLLPNNSDATNQPPSP